MQKIISFVIKNSNKLFFLLLLISGLFLIIQNHYYHRHTIISSSNRVAGILYEQSENLKSYLNLKQENKILIKENAYLKSILFNQNDTLKKEFLSNYNQNLYKIHFARVINNQYNSFQNFLVINAGKSDGIGPEMGVFNSLGVIGVVDKISNNYASVKSILNINQQLNAKTKRSNHKGIITWNGKSTGYVQMNEMPRLTTVKKGDTIVTSNSYFFPENINIGVIDKVFIDNNTSFYTLEIRLFNDMTNLGKVYVIKNKHKKEIEQIQIQQNKP